MIPEAYGGIGLGFGALAAILEEAGGALLADPLIQAGVLAAKSIQGRALPLRLLGTDEIRQHLLRLGNRGLDTRNLRLNKGEASLHLLALDGVHTPSATICLGGDIGRCDRRRGLDARPG